MEGLRELVAASDRDRGCTAYALNVAESIFGVSKMSIFDVMNAKKPLCKCADYYMVSTPFKFTSKHTCGATPCSYGMQCTKGEACEFTHVWPLEEALNFLQGTQKRICITKDCQGCIEYYLHLKDSSITSHAGVEIQRALRVVPPQLKNTYKPSLCTFAGVKAHDKSTCYNLHLSMEDLHCSLIRKIDPPVSVFSGSGLLGFPASHQSVFSASASAPSLSTNLEEAFQKFVLDQQMKERMMKEMQGQMEKEQMQQMEQMQKEQMQKEQMEQMMLLQMKEQMMKEQMMKEQMMKEQMMKEQMMKEQMMKEQLKEQMMKEQKEQLKEQMMKEQL